MNNVPDVVALLAMLKQVQAALNDALPHVDPEVKQYLGPLVEDLGNHQKDLAETVPQAIRDVTARRQVLIEKAAQLQRQADEWDARIAAMEAEAARAPGPAAPAAPKPAPAAPPKAHPTMVRPRTPVAAPNDGSVWKDNMSTWETETQGVDDAAPPKPEAPATPPAWDPDQSVRDLDDADDDGGR